MEPFISFLEPKKFWKRFRWWALLPLPIAIIVLNSFGPDGWREPLVRLMWLSWVSICLAVTHIARKVLHDYANAEKAWHKLMEDPVGAGLGFLGLCILTAALFMGVMSYAKADTLTTIPERAKLMAPLAKSTINTMWATMPLPTHLGSLIEQETCITLTHRFCWSTTAKLKTSREEGAGLGQLTRTWNADGSQRFDALAEVKLLDPKNLKDLTWDNVYVRDDLNLRAIVVKLRDCDKRMGSQTAADGYNRTAFCDAAYNGGMGGVNTERKLCGLTKGCDPQKWFANVELHSNKSRTKWQGYGKSAFDINREHVQNCLITRRLKYLPLLGGFA